MTNENAEENGTDKLVLPGQTTHWACYMIWSDHEERLSYKATSRSPRETRHPVTELLTPQGEINFGELVERYGEGSFRLQFYGTDAEGRFSSLGKSPVFVLGEPTHEPDEEDEEDEEEEEDDGPKGEDRPEAGATSSPRFVMPPNPLGDPLGGSPSSSGNGHVAPPPLPLPPVGSATPIPVPTTDPLAASLALFQFHMGIAAQARAEAHAQAELAIRRYEIDKRDALERARMQHEAELERQRMFYKEIQKGGGERMDPMAMMREVREMVADEIQAVEERVAERGGGNAQQNANGGTTAEAVIGALKEAMPIALPMIQSAMGGGNGGAGGQS